MNIKLFKRKTFYKDNEFLPSALEIMETPPTPGRVIFMFTIILLFVACFTWSFFGKIDIMAKATGKIQPQGSVKVVESLISGKVSTIQVRNGDKVNENDILMKFESSDAEIAFNEAKRQRDNTQGEIFRRRAHDRLLTQLISVPTTKKEKPEISWPNSINEEVKLREEKLFSVEAERVIADGSYYKSQITQNQRVTDSLRQQIRVQEDALAIQKMRVASRKKLFDNGVIAKDEWLNSLTTIKDTELNAASLNAKLAEMVSQQSVLQNTLTKYYHDAISENQTRMRQAELQFISIEAKFEQAKTQLNKTIIKSPASGIATSSVVTTQGQVISAGETIMQIVPSDQGLEVVAYVPNSEIGFIKQGQAVDIKIDAFPFTRYGTIPGHIISISHDAISHGDAGRQLDDSTSPQEKLSNGLIATQGLVYKVIIKPERNEIDVEGNKIPLLPGMGVVSEIKTGRRSVLSYLLGPLNTLSSNALHER